MSIARFNKNQNFGLDDCSGGDNETEEFILKAIRSDLAKRQRLLSAIEFQVLNMSTILVLTKVVWWKRNYVDEC